MNIFDTKQSTYVALNKHCRYWKEQIQIENVFRKKKLSNWLTNWFVARMHKLLRYESKRIVGRIKGNYWQNQKELLASSKRKLLVKYIYQSVSLLSLLKQSQQLHFKKMELLTLTTNLIANISIRIASMGTQLS